MTARGDARKRIAEQQADTTLVDILDAYFYSQNSVNWHRRHAEEVAALVAEHYWAEVAAERERAAAGDATWALRAPSLWESPDARSIPTLLAAIGQTLAALGGEATP